MKKFFLFAWATLSALIMLATPPKREFRGAWIQVVNGQFQGMSRDQMQANLTRQLDELQACRVNTVIFQVRAEADALYDSHYEPWSRFLTGKQGAAPSPYWDPLEWMVKECHKRGMELHAWINPYRAKTKGTTELASSHPYVQYPERFFSYDGLLIFDPGLQENRDYICMIVGDIVSRYNVDGIHIDDYFYPYPVAGVPIPDDDTFRRYNNGYTNRDDWRRYNVNLLIEELYETIHTIKPWVKFGVSPFGIYHNQRQGDPIPGSATNGLQNYDQLYADVLYWIDRGWVDYNVPQIYWEIGHKAADYETLIRWWSQYASKRPLVIGQDVERTVKAADLRNPRINQMPEKFRLQRTLPGVAGSCLWYSAAVVRNEGNFATVLKKHYHTAPALQPAMPFITREAPGKVKKLRVEYRADGRYLAWDAPTFRDWRTQPTRYVVYRFANGAKRNTNDPTAIVAITTKPFYRLPDELIGKKFNYVVTALNPIQNESKPRRKKVK